MENEIFIPIKGYEEYYEISDLGRIRRIKYETNANLSQYKLPFYIKYRMDKDGYLKCNLCKNNKIKRYFVHRLVALNFIDNPQKLPCVNHKDGNKQNNEVSNLEFCSVRYNNIHALETGLRIMKNNKLSKEVEQYDLEDNLINTYKSANDVHRILGISQSHVSECCRGEMKTYKGYKWKYKIK